MNSSDDPFLHIDPSQESTNEAPASDVTTQVETSSRSGVLLGLFAIAVLVVFGGSALRSTGTQPEPDATAANSADEPAEEIGEVLPPPSTAPGVSPRELLNFEVLQGATAFDAPIVMVPIMEGSRVDDPLILVVEGGKVRYRSLKTSLWTGNGDRVVRLNPGTGPHPVAVDASQVAIATLEGIHTQDLALGEPSRAVAQGISILPTAVPDSVWVIGNAGENVALVDLVSGGSIAEGSLAGFGYPLGAVANGLLVAPDANGNSDFNVWRVADDPVALQDSASKRLLGFGQTEAFFEDDGALLAFDLQSGAPLRNVTLELPEFRTGSAASPDGSRLAVSYQPSVVENNTIVVFDTTTGESTTAIDDALPWQFQWVDNHRLLYMQSDFPMFRIAVHDYRTNETVQLVEFDDFSWWFATTSALGQ